MSRARRATPPHTRPVASRVAAPRAAAAGVAVGLLLLVGSTGASASAAPTDDPGTLSVTITDGSSATPSPTPAASPAPGGAAGGSSGASGGSAPVGATRTVPVPASGSGGSGSTDSIGGGAVPAGEVSVAGMLYVGGLNASAFPEADPAGGIVDVWFTVRNAASTPVDATADFWLDTVIFPQRVDAVDAVAVTALQPGETRVVSARLRHGGQWTLFSPHVTFTPPESVDGVALTPVTRDTLTLLFPWVIVMLILLGVLTVIVVQIARWTGRSATPAVAATT